MTKEKTERQRLLAQLHIALNAGSTADKEYRDWLEAYWGVRSSADLDPPQLREAIAHLTAPGWLESAMRGDPGKGRPTPKQWTLLEALARSMEWNGLDAPELAAFLKRTAKVDSPRFLTRKGATHVITGLNKWIEQQAARQAGE